MEKVDEKDDKPNLLKQNKGENGNSRAKRGFDGYFNKKGNLNENKIYQLGQKRSQYFGEEPKKEEPAAVERLLAKQMTMLKVENRKDRQERIDIMKGKLN